MIDLATCTLLAAGAAWGLVRLWAWARFRDTAHQLGQRYQAGSHLEPLSSAVRLIPDALQAGPIDPACSMRRAHRPSPRSAHGSE